METKNKTDETPGDTPKNLIHDVGSTLTYLRHYALLKEKEKESQKKEDNYE